MAGNSAFPVRPYLIATLLPTDHRPARSYTHKHHSFATGGNVNTATVYQVRRRDDLKHLLQVEEVGCAVWRLSWGDRVHG